MDKTAPWEIRVCPLCDYVGRGQGCTGTRNDPHVEIETDVVEVVPYEQLQRTETEIERLRANLAAIRCEIDARRECASMETVRLYANEDADMRPETLMKMRK